MAKALVDRGHEVSIIIPPFDNLADSGKAYEIGGVNIINIGIPRKVLFSEYLIITKRIISTAMRLNPDIIHVFKPKGYSGLAGMLLRTVSRPMVVDTDDWEGYGGWNDVLDYSHIEKEFFQFQERWLPRHSNAVTVASRTLETQMWGFGVPPERVYYVPNGPNQLKYSRGQRFDNSLIREKYGLGEMPLIVLFTRFFDVSIDEIINIFRMVREEVRDARFMIVGKGRFDEERELVSSADKTRVRDAIILTGWIEPKDVPHYIYAANVAICPFKDTLINRARCSVKVIEHMIMSNAIVATKVGQNIEYIEDEKSGMLVEPGDIRSFAEKVVRILCDKNLERKLGENAQKSIWEKFSWNRLVVRVEKAYELAVGSK